MFAVIKPQICIHCAAIADPDFCEKNASLCRAVNVQATGGNVSKAAQKCASRLIFCSTDYVFGNEKLTYSESDEASPLQEYGRSKVLAERLVLETSRGRRVLRLPLPLWCLAYMSCGSSTGQPRLNSVGGFSAEGATLRYPLFHCRCRFSGSASRHGRRNMMVFSIFPVPEATTKLEWAKLVAQLCPRRTVSIRPADGATLTAERPASIRLDDSKAERNLLSFSPRSLAQGIPRGSKNAQRKGNKPCALKNTLCVLKL